MPKTATLWRTPSGTDTVSPDNEDDFLLLEDGDNILLETGDDILLEPNVVTPKHPTEYTTPAKIRTNWQARDGFSTALIGVSVARITEASDTRITEAGDSLVTEDVEFDFKNPTEWTNG